jgi:hypothetical protein
VYQTIQPKEIPMYTAQTDSGFVLLDTSGKLISKIAYEIIGPFSEGVALAVRDGKSTFIRNDGNEIIPPTYKYDETVLALSVCRNGKIRVKSDKGKVGMIDTNGKKVIPLVFEDLGWFDSLLIPARKGGKWGYIRPNQTVAIPFQFEFSANFYHGVGRINKKGKWGGINTKGKLIFPIDYEGISPFAEGLFLIAKDGKQSLCNAAHELLLPGFIDQIAIEQLPLLRLMNNDKSAYFNLSRMKILFAEEGFESTN